MKTQLKLITCLIAAALLGGCGSKPTRWDANAQGAEAAGGIATEPSTGQVDEETPFRLPAGAKTAVAAGRYDPVVTFDSSGKPDREVKVNPRVLIANPVTGAAAGALVGAVGAIGGCLPAGALAPVCMLVIGKPLVIGGGVAGAGMGAVAMSKHISVQDRPAVPMSEKQKALAEALEATARSREPLRPLVERVQGMVRERGAAGNDQTSAPEYVFELSVTGVEVMTLDAADAYKLRFHAEGRLVRLDDDAVVDRFAAHVDAANQVADPATAGAALSTELDPALQKLARAFVDGWIAPAVQTHAEEKIRKNDEPKPAPSDSPFPRPTNPRYWSAS